MKIYDEQGQRLYLTSNEREDFIEAAKNAPREIRTFCFALHWVYSNKGTKRTIGLFYAADC